MLYRPGPFTLAAARNVLDSPGDRANPKPQPVQSSTVDRHWSATIEWLTSLGNLSEGSMSRLLSPRRRLFLSMLLGAGLMFSSSARAEEIVLYEALDFAGGAAKAFAAKTGIDVKVVELASTGEVLGKVAAEGDHPQFDVLWLEG